MLITINFLVPNSQAFPSVVKVDMVLPPYVKEKKKEEKRRRREKREENEEKRKKKKRKERRRKEKKMKRLVSPAFLPSRELLSFLASWGSVGISNDNVLPI